MKRIIYACIIVFIFIICINFILTRDHAHNEILLDNVGVFGVLTGKDPSNSRFSIKLKNESSVSFHLQLPTIKNSEFILSDKVLKSDDEYIFDVLLDREYINGWVSEDALTFGSIKVFQNINLFKTPKLKIVVHMDGKDISSHIFYIPQTK